MALAVIASIVDVPLSEISSMTVRVVSGMGAGGGPVFGEGIDTDGVVSFASTVGNCGVSIISGAFGIGDAVS